MQRRHLRALTYLDVSLSKLSGLSVAQIESTRAMTSEQHRMSQIGFPADLLSTDAYLRTLFSQVESKTTIISSDCSRLCFCLTAGG